MRYEIHEGDNLKWLRAQPDNSIDSVCTDPPYGLGKEPNALEMLQAWIDHDYLEVAGAGFMGRKWDAFVPQPIFWKEVYRVLKPGGHVLSFAGTRTYDWMVMAIRLAGFEIRDQLIWAYGGGFPKSMDISKAIDKQAGAEREVVGTQKGKGGENLNKLSRQGAGDSEDGKGMGAYGHGAKQITVDIGITAPATQGAQQWEGWGTALSPSHEPIVLARKPIERGLTVAANVLKWGTGAINVDGCRIATQDGKSHYTYSNGAGGNGFHGGVGREADGSRKGEADTANALGRWPSNLIHDGSEVVEALFPQNTTSGKMGPQHKRNSQSDIYGKFNPNHPLSETIGDSGSASRYFYCAKPSQYERSLGKTSKESHPTVKPVAVMHHLVTLITPPNGVCLDPFCGSGTTGIGAMLAGPNIRFVGCEFTPEYIPIIHDRMKHWKKYRQFIEAKEGDAPARVAAAKVKQATQGEQGTLFEL